MSDLAERSGVLGADPLDSRVGLPGARRPEESWWVRHRLAAGLSATPVPGLLLVVGLALGPEGINLLSRRVLTNLDPAVSVALAALGLLFGLGFDVRDRRDRRLLSAASLESLLTLVLVGAGVLGIVEQQRLLGGALFVVLAAVCAAASSTSPTLERGAPASSANRLADLDNVLPIVLGGVALASFRAGSLGGGLWLALQCTAVAAAVTCAGWLLLGRSRAEGGRHVFTAGVVLLLGGLAEFLGTSAVLNGLVAGVLLGVLGGSARERMARDVGHIQHPLVVLLLLVAGARVAFTPGVLLVAFAYVALRLAGKIGGGVLLRPVAPGHSAWELSRLLVSPGALAAAFALNCGLAGADPAGLLLAVVVTGSVFSELLALVVAGGERR